MDLWSVHIQNTNRSPILLGSNSFPEKPISQNICRIGSFRGADVFAVRVWRRRKARGYGSCIVKAMGKKNRDNSSSSGSDDQSVPEGDGTRGRSPSDNDKSSDATSRKSQHTTSDWRAFRAALFAREKVGNAEFDVEKAEGTSLESKPLAAKWAHPIPVPETGCVLVATEKLDGVRTFERTVVLLLRSGSKHQQEGPFGVVINRPFHKKIKHMKPANLDLVTNFADCSLHFGGPLEASTFLLNPGEKPVQRHGFEEVMPGLSFGSRNGLGEAVDLVKKGVLKPRDFKFFIGYAGWQVDQLRDEIESDYWYVAACSPNLICGADSTEGLWEEILGLMGGHYSELGRKPKQDM